MYYGFQKTFFLSKKFWILVVETNRSQDFLVLNITLALTGL